jgi:hypothetical protein
MQPSDVSLHEAKEQLLTTALGDVKGSIHANDQKVSAALVVNGLLLTSVVNVVTHTDRTYKKAEPWAHTLGLALLALALVMFIASVGYLLSAMSPYRPETLEKKLDGRYPRVFFPLPDDLEQADPFGSWRGRVADCIGKRSWTSSRRRFSSSRTSCIWSPIARRRAMNGSSSRAAR